MPLLCVFLCSVLFVKLFKGFIKLTWNKSFNILVPNCPKLFHERELVKKKGHIKGCICAPKECLDKEQSPGNNAFEA